MSEAGLITCGLLSVKDHEWMCSINVVTACYEWDIPVL